MIRARTFTTKEGKKRHLHEKLCRRTEWTISKRTLPNLDLNALNNKQIRANQPTSISQNHQKHISGATEVNQSTLKTRPVPEAIFSDYPKNS